MSEIYWITRLDGLRIFFIIAVVCAIIAVVVMSAICYESYIEEDKQFHRKTITKLVIGIACGAMALVFLPTSNEALMIWGVGGSIDYLKANETAKQLPDKCIQALDAWVESINENKEE